MNKETINKQVNKILLTKLAGLLFLLIAGIGLRLALLDIFQHIVLVLGTIGFSAIVALLIVRGIVLLKKGD